jgi:probable phosphoglycerate mutase
VPAVEAAAARLPGPALLVTHGGALRALLAAFPVGSQAPAAPDRIPNAGVVRLSLAAGKPVLARWVQG